VSEQNNIEWATIGKVVALFGIRGELKVRLLTDIPNRFADLDVIYPSADHKRYSIESVRPYKGEMIILKLEGVDDTNAAEPLRNCDLDIPVSALTKLPPDSYYQHDILGLHVFTRNGREVGTIVDIYLTGSNDVYVIKAPDGRQILIPAIKDVIKQIDLIRSTMYIDPLPGLLDDQTESDYREEEEDQATTQANESH